MGSIDEERARFLDEAKAASDTWAINRIAGEGPQHRVQITRPLWLSRHEVTIGQFRQFAEGAKYKTDAEQDGRGGFGVVNGEWKQAPQFVWNADLGFPQTDQHPVVNISWNDSVAYCQWLSQKQSGWTFTLPTEAQREYACRAGTTTYWHFGDNADKLPEYGWFKANSGDQSHPVGQLKPNAFGLFDMHGNAWEWCADWFGANYFANSPVSDPGGPQAGSQRMHRGGGWDAHAGNCRSANRAEVDADWRTCVFGFRVAASPSDGASGSSVTEIADSADPN
jgi:formylglycine-generating enzyme required for sulfatase activity